MPFLAVTVPTLSVLRRRRPGASAKSTSPRAVSRALVERNLKTFFRINNGEGYAKAIIGLIGDMNVKSVSMVHSTKEATTDVANQVTEGLKAKGLKVTVHPFYPAITDFKPILHKIRLQDRPDVLAMVGYENDDIISFVALALGRRAKRPARGRS